jgi:ATP-binding cassette subfamily C protein
MRLAVARMLLAQGDAFCDEPTAKLDLSNAAIVRDALASAARTRRVVAATHDPQLIARAVRVVDLGTACATEAA